MKIEKMFEVANRSKMRFPSCKGILSVEEIWDLSVKDLDGIFKTLNSQVKQVKEESLLDKKTEADEILDMQIEIIKYIVSVKQDEENKRLQAKEKREMKQKLLALKAEKQDSDLKNKSIEEIDKMLEELEG